MTDYTAKIKAKGLDGTGFTEDLAASLFNRVGHHMLAIVEVQVVDKHGPNLKGQRGVELVITSIEPAEDSNLEDHLRELTRTLHFNRAIDQDQPTLDGGDGINPKVGDVIQAGVRHRPHPFLPVDASQDNGICDVCGLVEAVGVHSTQDFLPTDDDTDPDVDDLTDEPSEADVEAAQEPDRDPYDFVHAKGGSLPGEETVCALHATVGKTLRTRDDRDHVDCPDCLEQLDIDASFRSDDEAAASHQTGEEPTVAEVTAAQERHLSSVADPFVTPATT